MLCISTSQRMLAHAFTWLKTMKNAEELPKNTFFIVRTRDSIWLTQEHEEKCSFLCLGVPPKRWLTLKSWLLLSNFM